VSPLHLPELVCHRRVGHVEREREEFDGECTAEKEAFSSRHSGD
jgi:hypothetical protein